LTDWTLLPIAHCKHQTPYKLECKGRGTELQQGVDWSCEVL